jgi:sugar phosphate isomerase/epimerase
VDVGIIDWVGQFRAMKKVGYSDAVNLETHWKDGKSPESSSRRSWEGMEKQLKAAGAI